MFNPKGNSFYFLFSESIKSKINKCFEHLKCVVLFKWNNQTFLIWANENIGFWPSRTVLTEHFISNKSFCPLGNFMSLFAKWFQKDIGNGSPSYNCPLIASFIRKYLIDYFSKVKGNISSPSINKPAWCFSLLVGSFLNIFLVLPNSKYLKKKWLVPCWLRLNLFILKWNLFEKNERLHLK